MEVDGRFVSQLLKTHTFYYTIKFQKMQKLPRPILNYTHFYVFLLFCMIFFTSCAGLYIRSPSTNPPGTIPSPVIITINVDNVNSNITEVKLTDMTPGVTNTVIIAPSLFHWIDTRTKSCSYTVSPGTKYKLEVSGNIYNATYRTFRSKTISTEFLVSGISPLAPTISSLNPSSGPAGTQVRISGSNLQAINAVTFGTANGTNLVNVTSMGLNVTVPSNINGTVQVKATNGSQQAISPANFTVTAVTATPSPLVFRGAASNVESFNFTTQGSPGLINTQTVTSSPGTLGVSLATNGVVLVRSSAVDIQTFSINPSNGQLSPGSTLTTGVTQSGNGTGVFLKGNQVVRSSNSDIQVFSLSGTTLTLLGKSPSTGMNSALPSSTGTAIQPVTLNGKQCAVRAYSSGIEVFDISNTNSITLIGKNPIATQTPSAVGVGLFVYGTTAIRAYAGGLEIFDLMPATPIRILNNSGSVFASATGVDVISNSNGTSIVRATSSGIEVYKFSNGTLSKLGYMNGALSSTGVAVSMIGNRVFRAYDTGVEEYDITVPANIVRKSNFTMNVATGQTGVGITLK
jgi:IPT/TIG domain